MLILKLILLMKKQIFYLKMNSNFLNLQRIKLRNQNWKKKKFLNKSNNKDKIRNTLNSKISIYLNKS